MLMRESPQKDAQSEFVNVQGALQESTVFQGTDYASLQYVAWRATTSNRVVLPVHKGNLFLGSLAGLQIRAPANLRTPV
jgi:hypothetical protein